MNWPRGLTHESFLAGYWQKRPFFWSDAVAADLPILGAAELAWLATLDDVESRLVFTEREEGRTVYRVEHGPFEDDRLAGLPTRDWSLLVHDVEKHLPEMRRWLSALDLVPEWRVDDLMISFAAPGGSVGPHVDNYDVFLCQVDGTRNWRLARSGELPRRRLSTDLALVEPFDDPSPIRASAGSILYLPPRLPHWGIAEDACLTYSIGMRAPSCAELRLTFDREFPDTTNPFADDDARFYKDQDLQPAECAVNRISARAVDRCRDLMADAIHLDDRQVAATLGCTVTDVKAWLAPDVPDAEERAGALDQATDLLGVHGMARVAYWLEENTLLLFANGHCLQLDAAVESQVVSLCNERRIHVLDIMRAGGDALVDWLFDHGVVDWSSDPA